MKEAKFKEEKNLVFYENLNSEQEVRSRGGQPTDVDFSQGKGSFDGSSSKIIYSNLKLVSGVYTIRIKLTTSSDVTTSQMLVDLRGAASGTGYIKINSGEISVSGGTKYLNGSLGTSVAANTDYELVITDIPAKTVGDIIAGVNYSDAEWFNGDMDFIEVYNYAWSEEEIKNSYNSKRYFEPVLNNTILDINAFGGSIVNKNTIESISAPTLTDVEVVKDGDIYVPRLNGSSSKIDCGDYDDLTGDITIMTWVKPYSYGNSGEGRIIDNTKLVAGIVSGDGRLFVSSDGLSTTIFSDDNDIPIDRKSMFIAITRTSAGVTNIYINGSLSGDADRSSGIPEVGSNILIGSDSGGSAEFDGLISSTKIISGILTPTEINQIWTSERKKYNL